MLFVINKTVFQGVISVVRDDRTKKTQGSAGPFLRLEAKDNCVTIGGNEVLATIPATVYERGVLFLRATVFRRLLTTITKQKFLTIQAMAEGLLIENITLPLESNDMLLYPIPDQSPHFHPSVRMVSAVSEPTVPPVSEPTVSPPSERSLFPPSKPKRRPDRRQLLLWDEANFSSSKFADFAFVFTPKELRHLAQGCERSELPWGKGSTDPRTPSGFRHRVSSTTQPFQVDGQSILSPG